MKKDIFIVKLGWVDYLTLSGLVIISFSIGFALAGKLSYALSLMYIALIADAFDGVMARKFGKERDFGRYLDGFIDVFDYLVAPAIFLYLWGFNTWYYVPVLISLMTFGVIRLSVFNEIGNVKDEDQGLSYLGMPVFWSVLFLGIFYILSWFIVKEVLFPIMAVVYLLYSFLMIYKSNFYKFKSWKVMLLVLMSFSILFALDGSGVINGNQFAKEIITFLKGNHAISALLIILTSAVGGIFHMLVVTKDWFKFLKIPISKFLFGENKTIRGFVLMPIFSIPGAFLFYYLFGDFELTIDIQKINPIAFGLLVGFVYVLFELPNSFIKRRLGIAPGEEAKKFKLLFIFLDQLDSSLGGAILAYFYFKTPGLTAISVLFLGPVVALIIKRLLFIFKLKKAKA